MPHSLITFQEVVKCPQLSCSLPFSYCKPWMLGLGLGNFIHHRKLYNDITWYGLPYRMPLLTHRVQQQFGNLKDQGCGNLHVVRALLRAQGFKTNKQKTSTPLDEASRVPSTICGLFYRPCSRKSRAQTPPSHEEKGLVTIESCLGCAESAILIFEEVSDRIFMT